MSTRNSNSGAVASLARTAVREGIKRKTLVALVEAASEEGAMRALSHLGLQDEDAIYDIRALRNLLDAWRQARRTAWHTFIRWMTILLIVLILTALAMKVKIPFFY